MALHPDYLDLLTPQQSKRYEKIRSERMYFMGIKSTHICKKPNRIPAATTPSNVIDIQVHGEGDKSYTVAVHTVNNTISCNCMDARLHCRRMGCACKHICFVLYRIIRIPESQPLEFLRNPNNMGAALTEEQVQAVIAYANLSVDDGRSMFKLNVRPPDQEDDCPICFTQLIDQRNPPREFLSCPDCNGSVHRDCMETWLKYSPHKTCVYCRSTSWSALFRS
jgi:hypothetical protein